MHQSRVTKEYLYWFHSNLAKLQPRRRWLIRGIHTGENRHTYLHGTADKLTRRGGESQKGMQINEIHVKDMTDRKYMEIRTCDVSYILMIPTKFLRWKDINVQWIHPHCHHRIVVEDMLFRSNNNLLLVTNNMNKQMASISWRWSWIPPLTNWIHRFRDDLYHVVRVFRRIIGWGISRSDVGLSIDQET